MSGKGNSKGKKGASNDSSPGTSSSFGYESAQNTQKILNRMDQLFEKMNDFQNNLKELNPKVLTLEAVLKETNVKLDKIARSKNPNILSEEMIKDAKDLLNIDLSVEFEYKKRNLLEVEWNPENLNSYGLNLMKILFSTDEMSKGCIESDQTSKKLLDKTKVNLIKACYLRKLKTIDNFQRYWKKIVRSLNQKCYDSVRKLEEEKDRRKKDLKEKKKEKNKKKLSQEETDDGKSSESEDEGKRSSDESEDSGSEKGDNEDEEDEQSERNYSRKEKEKRTKKRKVQEGERKSKKKRVIEEDEDDDELNQSCASLKID